MDYSKFFSADVPSFLRSPVREIFRKVDLSAICSFAGGYPAAVTFPVEDIKRLSSEVLEKYGTKALQYGATQGVPELREVIARRYGVPVSQVQITTSSQQGIDVCTRVFVNPGDVVLANNPVYLGALQSFKAYRAQVMNLDLVQSTMVDQVQGIIGRGPISGTGPSPASVASTAFQGTSGGLSPGDKSGPSPKSGWTKSAEAEAQKRKALSAKFIYVIPDFNNPSGETMTLAEREEIVRLARELDCLIVEDSPYRELRYSGEPVKTIRELAPERTLHLGSFSKIFAPGFRLGWIIGPEELLEQIYICKQCLDLCPPVFDQYMAAEFMGSGALDRNLQKTIVEYRKRRDLMVALLEKYMPEGCSWTYPEGGLFLWLTLPEEIDTVALYDEALSAGVAYVAGSFFYVDGSHRNTMRMNFSFIAEEKMEPGIKILSNIIRHAI
jgi:2-aminoadipate transaminase